MTKSELLQFLERCNVEDDTEIFVTDDHTGKTRLHEIKAITYQHTDTEDTILIAPSGLVTDGQTRLEAES